MKKLLFILTMVLAALSPVELWAQGTTEAEPYAVLSENNTVLTFYYDDQKTARNGMDVGPFDGYPDYQSWYDQRESITSVVFDASFANCTTISSTAYWFFECNNLTTITDIKNLRTDNLTDMGAMFDSCSGLTSLDVSHFDTSSVTDMGDMFYGCSGLTSLDVSHFDTSSATDMGQMFDGCSGLTSLDVSHFNTSNVTVMHWMFDDCSGLTSLDVSHFNTSNVTYMGGMFSGCSGLTSLDVSNFNTSSVKYMGEMFYGCSGLTSLDVSHFDTSSVTDMGDMFYGCFGLTSLDLSNFNTSNVTSMQDMFLGCSNIVTVYVGNEWSTALVNQGSSMFAGCTKLVGGAGTVYDANHTDYTYAHIDGGSSNPGYFTDKNAPLMIASPVITIDGNILSIATSTIGANIYYTLDGSKPTKESTSYVEPITLTQNCCVRAIATMEGLADSEESVLEVSGLTKNMVLPTPVISHEGNLFTITVPSISEDGIDVTGKVAVAPSSWGGSVPDVNLSGEWTCNAFDDNGNVSETYGVTLYDNGKAEFPSPCLSGNWSYKNGVLQMFHNRISQDSNYQYLDYELTTSTPENPIEFIGKRTLTVGNWITENIFVKNVKFTYNGASLALQTVAADDSRETVMAVVDEGSSEKTGELLQQSVTGLENGYYTIELYAKSVYSSAQSMSIDVTYLFANETKLFIPVEADKEIHEHNVYKIGVEVTNGTLRLGLGKDKTGANWHALQIKSLKRHTLNAALPLEGATIYYTTDDSTPTTASTQYESHFTLTENCTIKAVAVANGYSISGVATYVVDWIDLVAAPTFRFDGDYLVIETATEDASIFYQMADLPDMSEETIEKVSSSITVTANIEQSNYYEQPIELKKSVVLKAIAAGATESEVSVLVYDYDSWHKLLEAIDYGWNVQELAKDNANVDANLKEQLSWAIDEGKHIFEERATIPYQEAQHFTNQIYEICAQIEEQMGGSTANIIQFADAKVKAICVQNWDKDGDGELSKDEAAAVTEMSNTLFRKNEDITSFDELQYFTGLTSLQYSSFERCTHLASVVLPANLITVGNDVFYGCSSLTSIIVPDNVVNVGANTWNGCSNVTYVHIGKGLASVNVNPFGELTSLETFEVDEANMAFCAIDGILMSKNGKKLVQYPAGKRNENYVIPETIENVSGDAFRGCKYLKSLVITKDSQVRPDEANGYWYIYSLEELTLQEGVEGIGSNAFMGCSSLKTIHIPTTLNYIGKRTFEGCNNISSIISEVVTPFAFEDDAFTDEVYNNTIVLVPDASVTSYKNTAGWKNFKYIQPVSGIDATFDSNGVLTVGSGTTMADALESVGGRAEVAKTITAIVWNNETELTDADLQGLDNPNMLIYVTNESLAPQNRNNIITYDFAKNIVLTDVSEGNGNFYCPQEFKAEKITYIHDYGQTTEIGVARGWESIALPFAVQTITHETKGLIAPFGTDASNKHFWLRQLTENGLARATIIEPNTAYLISMPNSDAYYADFNLNGRVTFSSQDVWVPKTQIHAVDYHTEKGMVVLLPNFQRRASDYTTYALNVGEQRGDYPEGSVFEREYRDIRPFEAYTFHQGGAAPRFLPISDLNGNDATGIEEVRSLRAEGRGDVWYDMSGRRLQQKPAGKGVYILNGRKVVIK